jgi:hypothetical protein
VGEKKRGAQDAKLSELKAKRGEEEERKQLIAAQKVELKARADR